MAIKKDTTESLISSALKGIVEDNHIKEIEKNNSFTEKKKKERFDVPISVKLTSHMFYEIEEIAYNESAQISDIVRRALVSYIKKYKEKN